ncbi:hypothetical protein ACI8AF_21670 [Blastococcus sp. SYSU D00669]
MAGPQEPASSRPRPGAGPTPVAEAIGGSLSRYPWRALTVEMVTAMALAAADGARVDQQGTHAVAGRDERLPAVAEALQADPQWRRRPADVVARCLAEAMATREEERFWFDVELDWLLDPPS